MTVAGTAKQTENRDRLVIEGVYNDQPVSKEFIADQTYPYNGKTVSGQYIINNYWQNYYTQESANFMTNVNALRLRSVSLSYSLPKKVLAKTNNFIKNCTFTVSGNNLLLFTNYYGDPEVAAAGAGTIGSSSVGIDWCCVPALAGCNFGINLTF